MKEFIYGFLTCYIIMCLVSLIFHNYMIFNADKFYMYLNILWILPVIVIWHPILFLKNLFKGIFSPIPEDKFNLYIKRMKNFSKINNVSKISKNIYIYSMKNTKFFNKFYLQRITNK